MSKLPPTSPNKALGTSGEKIACQYLVKQHFQILETNYHFKHLEIDIIALDQNKHELVFFEVKTRSNSRLASPISQYKLIQLNRLIQAAQKYITDKSLNYPYRFDIIGILPNQIDHLENITAE